MKLIQTGSPGELEAALASLGADVLFRGQTAHYEKDGAPSIVTSFDRRGCIPPVMLKWSRYARNLLETYLGEASASQDFTQALLQHYGWRSFYIDCSSSAAVSAWFASHSYKESIAVELCEDYEERPIFLRKRKAHYEFSDGEGFLYVLDKSISKKSVGLIDLASIHIEGARPRTQAQHAWLLGPLRHQSVPADCVIAQISAPRVVFRDYAASHGFTETGHLFPSRTEDPILDALLSIPWKEIPLPDDGIKIPAFRRGLDIPEYHDTFRKISSPATAFYRGEMIGKQEIKFPGLVTEVSDTILFGTPDSKPFPFSEIEKLVAEHKVVAFEIDDLLPNVHVTRVAEYQKGIVVAAHGDDLFEVGELVVEHPGLDLAGAGVNKGWYYRRNADGVWTREENSDQCPCHNTATHYRHYSALKLIEMYLRNPKEF